MEKSIIIEQEYPHRIEDVWEAITDQEEIRQWLMNGTFEPQIGREFEFWWEKDGQRMGTTWGKVMEMDKPRKLSYTWDWGSESTPGGTLVTFYLEPTAAGNGTKLRFEHTGFKPGADENVFQGAQHGWNSMLPKIGTVIEKRKQVEA
jgi:uncharacterized protein YndB with AHSA1/START domain